MKKIPSLFRLSIYLPIFVFSFLLIYGNTPTPTPTPTVEPSASPTPVKVTIQGLESGQNALILFEGQKIEITNVTDSTLEFKSTDKNLFTTEKDPDSDDKWLISVKNDLPNGNNKAEIKVVQNNEDRAISGFESGRIPVTVYKLPQSTSISLKIGETKKLSTLLDLPSSDPIQSLKFSNSEHLEINGNDVTAKSVSAEAVEIKIEPKSGKFEPRKNISFQIASVLKNIEIVPNPEAKRAYINSSITLKAFALKENGERNSEQTKKIKWKVKKTEANDNKDEEKVNLRQTDTPGEVIIDVLEVARAPIILAAQIEEGGKTVEATIPLYTKGSLNVIGFGSVDLRIDMMDPRTAKDLFGKVTTNEYMVAKLRIFNKIPIEQNGGPASSILFFSEALEVNVGLEKRPLERVKNQAESKNWLPLDFDDVEYINNWNYIPKVDDKLIEYFITRTIDDCSNDLQRLLRNRACEISATELDRLWYFYEKNRCAIASPQILEKNIYIAKPALPCQDVAAKNWIPFRPYAFLVMDSTYPRRNERSKRERILLGINMLLGLTSLATTFSGTTNNTGLLYSSEKVGNLLVPAYEKFFPSRREIERKNILDMALQPFEEIPFGKEVSKIVFFPREEILGVLPGYAVRITTVSVFKIKAETSVLQKERVEQR